MSLFSGYSSKRKCRRWPVSIFCNLMDVSAVNTAIITKRTSSDATSKSFRYDFLKALGYQLVEAHLQRRAQSPNIQRHPKVKLALQLLNKLQGWTPVVAQKPLNTGQPKSKRSRCEACGRGKDRKAQYTCVDCGQSLCKEHSITVVHNCTNCFTADQ